MLQEINIDIATWWNEQNFPGKELFTITETGALTLVDKYFLKERIIDYISLENADLKLKVLQEKFVIIETKTADIALEWDIATDKTKLQDKIDHLKNLLLHIQAVGDFVKPLNAILEWEKFIDAIWLEHYNAKLLLVEQAEKLVDNENWKETSQSFKEIIEKWKKNGVALPEKLKEEKLWKRIEAARNKFYDKKKQHFEDEEKDMLQNLDVKIEIVEQAEALANSEEWKKTTEAFHTLMDKWKETGKTVNKRNEELWQRFLLAKNNFFDRKKAHSLRIQEEQEKSVQQKLELITKAVALKDRTDWVATAKEFDLLMEEWKKTGKVPAEKSEELWKRFTDAHNFFFDAKRKHTDSIRREHQYNYELKMELLDRAEQIKNSHQWFEATTEMNDLLDRWKQIGPVSKEVSNEIWEAFIAARKHFFDRKDAYRDLKKKDIELRVIERAKHAKDLVIQLNQQIKEEEDNLKDFQLSIQNITPGKKAEQLRKHLEQLIKDTTEKLERLKQKQAANEKDLQ